MPLGTGNDIGRAFGWGGGYSGELVEGLINEFYNAKIAKLDRWKVDILPFDISLENSPQSSYLNNYLSIGFFLFLFNFLFKHYYYYFIIY